MYVALFSDEASARLVKNPTRRSGLVMLAWWILVPWMVCCAWAGTEVALRAALRGEAWGERASPRSPPKLSDKVAIGAALRQVACGTKLDKSEGLYDRYEG